LCSRRRDPTAKNDCWEIAVSAAFDRKLLVAGRILRSRPCRPPLCHPEGRQSHVVGDTPVNIALMISAGSPTGGGKPEASLGKNACPYWPPQVAGRCDPGFLQVIIPDEAHAPLRCRSTLRIVNGRPEFSGTDGLAGFVLQVLEQAFRAFERVGDHPLVRARLFGDQTEAVIAQPVCVQNP